MSTPADSKPAERPRAEQPGAEQHGPRTPVLSGRALALALLGWSFIKVLARLLFTKESPGLEVFIQNYGAEGLTAIDKSERESLERFSRCIACSRCDVGEGERIAASRGAYPGLMRLVLASTRSMPDYDAALRGFEHVPLSVLRDKEAVCPVKIPFAELAEFVRAHAPTDADSPTAPIARGAIAGEHGETDGVTKVRGALRAP